VMELAWLVVAVVGFEEEGNLAVDVPGEKEAESIGKEWESSGSILKVWRVCV